MLMPRSDSFDIGPAVSMSAAVYAAMTTRRTTGGRATSGRSKRHSGVG